MCSNGPVKIKIGLVLGLSLTFASMAHANFSDIDGHTNEQAILYVQSQGIVQGYSDGSFKPNATINRAEFTKIIIGSQYSDTTIANCTIATQVALSDVPPNEWFAKYVCTAQKNGLIGGYPDTTFRPGNTINYAEAAKILVGAYNLPITELPGQWYEKYTNAIVEAGAAMMPPLSPDSLVTRGQMAQLIYNFSVLPQQIGTPQDQVVLPAGVYTTYQESYLAAGSPVVLFFHATWCPSCKAHDAFLQELYASNSPSVSVLSIDYDSSADLKAKYGVVTQDTFVYLDANGDVVQKLVFPKDSQVLKLLM